jgi:hypothetical protein
LCLASQLEWKKVLLSIVVDDSFVRSGRGKTEARTEMKQLVAKKEGKETGWILEAGILLFLSLERL